MKRKLPLWIVLLSSMILFTFGYVSYLILHCNDAKQTLDTMQGTPSALSGIQLDMETELSEHQDKLITTIKLGDSLKGTHHFAPCQSENNRYYGPNTMMLPSIDIDMKDDKSRKNGHVQYKTIVEKIPFSCRSYFSNNSLPFPFIDVDTPGYYYVDFDNHGQLIPSNPLFSISTTAYTTLNDSHYFSVTSVESLELVPYQLNGGIFKETDNKIECVYDYTISSSSKNKVIALFALEELNCLGLVVNEDTLYYLKLIDPYTKEEKASYKLADIPSPKEELLSTLMRIHYHSGTKTLLVSTTSYTPNDATSWSEKFYANYLYYNSVFETYEKDKAAFDKAVTTTETMTCYKVEDFHTLTPLSTYSLPDIRSKLHENSDLLLYADDYMYHDGILYVVAQDNIKQSPFPYLIALKGNDVQYEGFLITDVSEDYRLNRKGIDQYNLGNKYDQTLPLYSYYQRIMGNFKLSLAN